MHNRAATSTWSKPCMCFTLTAPESAVCFLVAIYFFIRKDRLQMSKCSHRIAPE
ncbi:hypothetical protein QTP70_022790 [Hemibagrus guttatus]|uniref:Uncharacterized protein n=1 Tax=Hemibagrus guttatus TaxID=175788 RepID=A0AAE0PZ71_9TELE|nr:hypothetical protein QTP70_022790 [Hemibagrus guttatus]KAK3530381.1 hypothetical protein QTP86_024417 [Hemibagrus guttatus]